LRSYQLIAGDSPASGEASVLVLEFGLCSKINEDGAGRTKASG
jgi:hypothetical protein